LFWVLTGAVAFVACMVARGRWIQERPGKSRAYLWLGVGSLAATFLAIKYVMYPGSGSLWSMLAFVSRGTWDACSHLFNFFEEPFDWLHDPDTSMLACVIPMVWAGMGPGCLIYLAALKGIPDDLYEASDIDGATFIDKILFVVFPILRPLVIINFVSVFIASWYGATGRILAMTGGQANTQVAGLYIFYKAFIFLKMGQATAAAWVLAFMLIGFSVYQLRILSRLEFKTTGDKK
jgi:multiple sugar transport system permease protein